MRGEFITFVLSQCQTQPPLWSMEQAVDLLQYFDSCWHLPEHWRTSWIDELRLSLLAQGMMRGLGLGLGLGLGPGPGLGLGPGLGPGLACAAITCTGCCSARRSHLCEEAG